MASLNKVILIGNLTKDPELKQTPSGTSVVSFSIGVSRKYSGADGSRETDFINIVAWKGTAEFIAKYFRKGNGISIVGSLQVRSYDSNGQKRYVTEVVADEASFVERKSDSAPKADDYQAPAFSAGTNDAAKFEEVAGDEDLPF